MKNNDRMVVFNWLLENTDQLFTVRQVQEESGVDRQVINRLFRQFEEIRIMKRIPGTWKWTFRNGGWDGKP